MSQGRTHPQVEDVPEKMWSLGRRCPQEADVFGNEMCSGRRHPWKETSPARRHRWEGVIHRELSLGRRCLWEDSISWKETSPARMPLGRCHPQGGVSGKVSGRGCPWEDVILRKEMCLRRRLQEDTVLGKKMFPGSRYTWEDVIPWKVTSLSWTSQGRCHLQGCVTRKKTSQGRRHPLGRRHPPSSSPHPWSPSRERQGTQ